MLMAWNKQQTCYVYKHLCINFSAQQERLPHTSVAAGK